MAEGSDGSKGLPEVYLSPSRKSKKLDINKTFIKNDAVSTDTDVWNDSDSGEWKAPGPGLAFTMVEDRNVDEHSRDLNENKIGSHKEQSVATSKDGLDKNSPVIDDQEGWRSDMDREELNRELLGASAPNTPVKGPEEGSGENEMKNVPQNLRQALWSQKRGETPGSDNLGVGGVTGSKMLRKSGNVGINLLPTAQNKDLYLPGGTEGLIIPGGLHVDYDLASSDTEDIDWLSGRGSWSGGEAVDRDTVGADGAPAAVYPPRSIGTSTAQLQRNSPAGLSTPDADVDLAAQVVRSTFQGQQVVRPPVMGQSGDIERSSRKDLGSTDGEESERDITRLVPMAVVGDTHSYAGIQQSSFGSVSENTDSANTVLSREEVQGCETLVNSSTKFSVSSSSGILSPRAQGFTKPNFVVGGAISPRGQFQQIQNAVRGRMQDLKASLDIQPEGEGLTNDREHFLNNAPLFQNFVSIGEQEVSLASMISVESTQHPESSERGTSPSVLSVSSVASSKKLEWDSGADVGYAGIQPEQSNASLSTLERIAIGSYASVLRTEPEGTTYVKDKQKFSKISKNVTKSSSELKPEVKKTLTTKKYSDSIGSRAWRMQQFNIASSSEDSVPSKLMDSSQSPRRKPRRRLTHAGAKQDSALRRSSKSRHQSANRVKQVILEARREGKSSSLVELSCPPLELQEYNRSTSQQAITGTKKIGSVVESSSSLTRHSSLGTVTGSSVSVVTAVESYVVDLEKLSHGTNTIANATSPVQGNSLVSTSAHASPVKCRIKSPAKVAIIDTHKHCTGSNKENDEKNVFNERQFILSSYSSIESGRNMKTSETEILSDTKDTVDSSSTSLQPTDEETGDSRCQNDVKNAKIASRTLSTSSESTTKASEGPVPLYEINSSLQCLSKDLNNRIKNFISEGSFKKVDDYQKLQEYIAFIGTPSSSVQDCRLKQSIASVIMRMFMEVSNVDCRSMNESQASSSHSCDTVEASVLSSTNDSQPSLPSTSCTQGSQYSGQLCEADEHLGQECDISQKKYCTTQEKQNTTHEVENTFQKEQCAPHEEQDTATIHTAVVPYRPTSASRTYYMAVAQESVGNGVEADCTEVGETAANLRFRNQNQQELPRDEVVIVSRDLQEQSSQEYSVAGTQITTSVTFSASTSVLDSSVAHDNQHSFPDHERNFIRSQPEPASSRISGETGDQYGESRGIHLLSNIEVHERFQDSHNQHRQDLQLDIGLKGNDHQRNRNVPLVDSVRISGRKERAPEAEPGLNGSVESEICPDRSGKDSEVDVSDLYDWRNRPTRSERRFYKDRQGTLHIAHQPPGYTEDRDSLPSESLSEQEVSSRNTAASGTCYEAVEASRAWSSTGSESAYETIREHHRHVDEALASSFEFYSTSPRETRCLEYVSVNDNQEQEARTPLATVTSPQGLMVSMLAENTELPLSQASELLPPSVPPSSSVTDTLSSPGQAWSLQDQWDGAYRRGNTAFSSPASNQCDISSQLSLIREQKQKYVRKLQDIVPFIHQIQSLDQIERALREQFRSSVSHTEGNDSNTLDSPMTQRLSGTATSSIVSSDFSEGDQISWSSGLRKKDVIMKETTAFIQHSGRSSRMNSTEFSTPSFSALKEMEEEVKKLRSLTRKAVESREDTLRHCQRNGRQSNKAFCTQSGSQQAVSRKHMEDTDISSYAQSCDTASSSRDRVKERIRDKTRDRAKQLDISTAHHHMSQQSLSRAFRLDTESAGYPVKDSAASSSGDMPRQSDVTSTVESISDNKIHHSNYSSRQHIPVVRDIPGSKRPSRNFSARKDSVPLLSKEKGGKLNTTFDKDSTDFENEFNLSSKGQCINGGYATLSARQLREISSMWPRSTAVSTEVMEKNGNVEGDDFVTSTLKKIVTEQVAQQEIGMGAQHDLTDTFRGRSDLNNALQGSSDITRAHQVRSGQTDILQGRSDLTDALRDRSDLIRVFRGRGDHTDALQDRSELPDALQGRQNDYANGQETYSSNRVVSSKNLYSINGHNEDNLGFMNEGQPTSLGVRVGTEAGKSSEENAQKRKESKVDKKDFSQMFPSFLLDPSHTALQFHNVGVQTGESILQDSTGTRSLDDISLGGKSRGKRYEQQALKSKSKQHKDEGYTEKGRYKKDAKFLNGKLNRRENKRPSSAEESHHKIKAVIEQRSSSASRTELESGSRKEFSSSDVYVEKVLASPISSRKMNKFKDTAKGVNPRTKHGGNVLIVSGKRLHKSRRPSSAKESQHRTRISREERSNSVSRTDIVSDVEELSSAEIWDETVKDSVSTKRGDHSSAMKEVNRRTKSERRIHESRRPSSAKERQQPKVIREWRSSSASGRSTGLESESHSLSQPNNNSQLSSASSTLGWQRNKTRQKQSNKQKHQGQKVSVEPLDKENERIHTRHQRKTVMTELEELRKEKEKGKERRTASRKSEETFKYATSKQHRNVRIDISYSNTSSSVERISLVTSGDSHSLLPKGTAKQDPVAFTVPLGELESLSDIDPEMKVWLKKNQERMKTLGIEMPQKPVLSLQEALATARPGYVRTADRRRAFLRVKRDMRKEASDLNKLVIQEMPSKMDASPTTLKNHLYRPTMKPLFSYKEIREQNCKLYKNLPETKNPVDAQHRKALYRSNRVMASVYSQQLRKKVLTGKVSHAHKNIITPTRGT